MFVVNAVMNTLILLMSYALALIQTEMLETWSMHYSVCCTQWLFVLIKHLVLHSPNVNYSVLFFIRFCDVRWLVVSISVIKYILVHELNRFYCLLWCNRRATVAVVADCRSKGLLIKFHFKTSLNLIVRKGVRHLKCCIAVVTVCSKCLAESRSSSMLISREKRTKNLPFMPSRKMHRSHYPRWMQYLCRNVLNWADLKQV